MLRSNRGSKNQLLVVAEAVLGRYSKSAGTIKGGLKQMKDNSSLFLRLALGVSFLAAVADRFGLWGSFGQPNVAWGDFLHFVA